MICAYMDIDCSFELLIVVYAYMDRVNKFSTSFL